MNILANYNQYLMFKFCTLTTVINGRELKYDIETNEIWGQNYNRRGRPREVKLVSRVGEYLCMRIGNKKYLHHRVIYKFYNPNWDIDDSSTDNSIDHINGTTNDNRIANLRNVTNQQNGFNQTRAKGYYWDKGANKWRAYIKLNGKTIYLGLYDLEEDAHNTYLKAKKVHHIITPIREQLRELQEPQ
jgi:hypothetical protein